MRRWLRSHLEVVGQFRATGVPRVHGDKDAAVVVALDHVAHEHQRFLVCAQGVQNGQHLCDRVKKRGGEGCTSSFSIRFRDGVRWAFTNQDVGEGGGGYRPCGGGGAYPRRALW